MTNAFKLSSILTTCFRDLKSFVTAISHAPWWPCFLTDQVCFNFIEAVFALFLLFFFYYSGGGGGGGGGY